ncbi:ferrous iron transport protein A [Acidobacteriota bacterium]
MVVLSKAPQHTQLKIIDFEGGHGVRRRLLSLGFHKNDIIQLNKKNILGGPILVTNLSSDTSVALGRGVAKKILVEIIE